MIISLFWITAKYKEGRVIPTFIKKDGIMIGSIRINNKTITVDTEKDKHEYSVNSTKSVFSHRSRRKVNYYYSFDSVNQQFEYIPNDKFEDMKIVYDLGNAAIDVTIFDEDQEIVLEGGSYYTVKYISDTYDIPISTLRSYISRKKIGIKISSKVLFLTERDKNIITKHYGTQYMDIIPLLKNYITYIKREKNIQLLGNKEESWFIHKSNAHRFFFKLLLLYSRDDWQDMIKRIIANIEDNIHSTVMWIAAVHQENFKHTHIICSVDNMFSGSIENIIKQSNSGDTTFRLKYSTFKIMEC